MPSWASATSAATSRRCARMASTPSKPCAVSLPAILACLPSTPRSLYQTGNGEKVIPRVALGAPQGARLSRDCGMASHDLSHGSNGCGNKSGKNPFFLYPGVAEVSYCLFAGGIRRCLPEQLRCILDIKKMLEKNYGKRSG